MKKQKKEAKRAKKFEDLDLTIKTRPAVHIKPKRKKTVSAAKYGVFTCSRCGGPKSGKSPGTLCYGCKHPERVEAFAKKIRPVSKRRKKRRKKNRRTQQLASTAKRYRERLVLKSIAVEPSTQVNLDELMTEVLLGGDSNEA